MRKFAIREAAEMDIISSAEWYERQRIGLGLEFLREARAVIDAIEVHGEYVTAPYKRYTTFVVRRQFLDRFPYRIFFVETDAVREVIAVLRDGQDEARWKARL
jgi:toxin ParE1/3/4